MLGKTLLMLGKTLLMLSNATILVLGGVDEVLGGMGGGRCSRLITDNFKAITNAFIRKGEH